jgi:hypothetical protein
MHTVIASVLPGGTVHTMSSPDEEVILDMDGVVSSGVNDRSGPQPP